MISLYVRLVQHRKTLLTVLTLAALGCDRLLATAPASGPLMPAFSAAPSAAAHVEVPIHDQIIDLNPCTGEIVTTTFAGIARLHEVGEKSIFQVRGTAVTSDGYTGTLNWTWVLIGDRVAHFRLHDTEVSNGSGQRILFAAGVNHTTSVDGQPVVEVLHLTDLRCVGKRGN